MKTTRDFLLVQGEERDARAEAPGTLMRWHVALGGASSCWTSAALRCRLWGPPPATITARQDGGAWQVACLVTGAPAGFASLTPETIERELLRAYCDEGLTALARVDGSFCGMLLDERRGAFLFTDRFGFRKAFVVSRGEIRYASSRAVVLGRGLDLPLDTIGAASCTIVGHTLGRRTIFESCEALLPATARNIGSGQDTRYWDIGRHLGERRRDRAAARMLRERFNGACHALVAAQHRPAANVTGGFDTRAVLSAALKVSRPVGVTSGQAEARAIDRVVAAAGIEHHYFPYHASDASADTAFALLTDGEWDASHGGAVLDYWRRVAAVAPSGCLHGGLGEVWRSYHYKFLWPPIDVITRDPLGHLAARLLTPRSHAHRVLRPGVRRDLTDAIRGDARPLWAMVGDTGHPLAAMDAFYLLERQRGLTRITSAADLWNPAYTPFGHSLFCETALGYLGAQNRDEGLHREIIVGNAPSLAALERYGGGNCLPLSRSGAWLLLAASTGRHLAGRAIGGRLRALLKGDGVSAPPDAPGIESFADSRVFDPDALGRAFPDLIRAGGAGNVIALACAATAPAVEILPLLNAGPAEGTMPVRRRG